ncbi:hypothetical protein I3843_13G138400 [Carya illinoinensis]|nr:hypothetical protein I3843_13G138400 [Carya illinoinensis]
MFPHLEEKLYLYKARWKPVQQTITNASSFSASSTPIAFSSPPLSKLKRIILNQIEDLETLLVQNLISLQHLTMNDCPKLKSLSQGVQYLTALQELDLSGCPVLDLGNDEHGMQWKGLKSLVSLQFTSMPKLVSLPLGLQHVTTLRELQISDCSSLMAIPEWICNWVSLERFTINTCSSLTSLPEAMSWLTSLRVLQILYCPMLDLGNDEHGMQWKGLKSLISLVFMGMPKLVSLPLGLQHVTTLRELQISDCSSLMAIPEWICNWASLEQFTINTCSGLTSLPEAMSRLTSLEMLRILDCPILLRRCEQERGEDWPKIAHIPNRYIF